LSRPAMDWENDLENWLSPFLDRLQNVAQRRWMPLYVQGLLGPGERKSVEALAHRLARGRPVAAGLRHRLEGAGLVGAPDRQSRGRALGGGPLRPSFFWS